jgi:pimeloyl-ACP methyl ester carboxylesterase
VTGALDRPHVWRDGAGGPPLLLLHGTGGDEHDLLPLADRLSPRSPLLSPRGEVLEQGMPRFFRRLAEGVFDEDDLRRRTDELADFVAAAADEHHVAPGSFIAVGFSNGANIASSLLMRRPEVLGGSGPAGGDGPVRVSRRLAPTCPAPGGGVQRSSGPDGDARTDPRTGGPAADARRRGARAAVRRRSHDRPGVSCPAFASSSAWGEAEHVALKRLSRTMWSGGVGPPIARNRGSLLRSRSRTASRCPARMASTGRKRRVLPPTTTVSPTT